MATKKASASSVLVPIEIIEQRIYLVRNQKVMLDQDLAQLYEVENRTLIQAVKRNLDRFPEDFMFQFDAEEAEAMRSQFVTASKRNVRYRPYAFTEQGVAMLSSVLRSKRAVQVNIVIMRAFVNLRQVLMSNEELNRKLTTLEKKYDAQFKVVFDALRNLIETPVPPSRQIGFKIDKK
ncbi:MAG: ORF6N domain-containing protein [Pyrinomonadaceae bacterium MAG19_C2-C3]|nr:ORF6N domain-containing protein [Pyrinomonadaceae bacterium MAG19_C2-C3]